MADLYAISPELTCSCDEVHICQQCQSDITSQFEEEIANGNIINPIPLRVVYEKDKEQLSTSIRN
tara:strand:- start:737 stop:931 length:195 start_codon:yes stop_codon:yes gene_type:complete